MRNNTSHKQERFLSVIAAAGHIDRHRSTLDKWRAEHIVLPFYKDNGKIFYDVNDLDEYLASCRVEPIAYGLTQEKADDILDIQTHTLNK